VKNNLFKTAVVFGILFGAISCANAVYVNDNGDYEAEADKFIPQKRTQFNASELANRLENTMQKANGNFNTTTEERNRNNNTTEKPTNPNYRKTYRWF
jgi:hypothetical protein